MVREGRLYWLALAGNQPGAGLLLSIHAGRRIYVSRDRRRCLWFLLKAPEVAPIYRR